MFWWWPVALAFVFMLMVTESVVKCFVCRNKRCCPGLLVRRHNNYLGAVAILLRLYSGVSSGHRLSDNFVAAVQFDARLLDGVWTSF